MRSVLQRIPVEALVWAAGLAALACLDPNARHLFSLCPLRNLGFTFCPGCGLGHAVAHLFRGDLVASWQAHPLGLPAVLVLAGRIVALVRQARHTPNVSHTG
ncbi:DUF2752 domain-containing protein [Rhodocaloribacter litoris]|uniref:DUF2752 domain-containing protein n=1 Tax=Rhodocaloribacter litoris TaxID=2558931 RepID=UPI0014230668|nr:DUF2752 domain-containing protein [Rhodocaloribacter litoris]QXD17053.1 DUF2752 domain-containing protein [Rhodocaloribacter litoris]